MLYVLVLGASVRAAPVKNGEFRIGAGLEGWQPGHAAYRFADDEGFRDPGCLLFTGPAPANVAGPSQEIRVKPNTEYVLSAALKSDGRLSPSVLVRRGRDDIIVSANAGRATTWTSALVRFNTGANEKLTVTCVGTYEATPEGGRAWFDDIAILLPEEVPAGRRVEGGFMARPPGENIARGCPVTFGTAPNYGYSTDPGDATQLTDGEYSAGYFWVQKSTVGWCHVSPVVITIDLGKAQPIGGLSYNTAAGCAGVGWPSGILVIVSDDEKTWRYVDDLLVLAAKNGLPAADRYSVYRYVSGDFKTRGRYVRLAVGAPSGFTFCDEIEVYRGPEALLSQEPTSQIVTADIKELVSNLATRSGVFWRLTTDLTTARTAIGTSKLPEAEKNRLLPRLQAAEQELPKLPLPDPETFRAILPLNDTHARILSVYGPLLRARGLPSFFAWKKNRFDYLTPTEAPAVAPSSVSLSVEMMGNEFRSDAFLLTNATEEPVNATVRVQGLPGAPRPSWLSVSAVPWTDTSQRVPIAAALPEARYDGGTFRVPVPAGMTCKVWLTIDSSSLKPGSHKGNLVVEGAGHRIRVPFGLRVSPVKMGRPRLSVGMWDYTNGKGAYGIAERNLTSAIEMMRSHFVDSPWATQSVLPWPEARDFDANHQLMKPLDFSAFNEWVKRWPNARHYLVFANVLDRSVFAGERMGTASFNARVGAWAKAIAEHAQAIGLKPKQLGLLLVDEPSANENDEFIAGWAQPIKAVAPEITLFEDTAWERPDLAKIQEAITLADILCPYLGRWYTGGDAAQQYYQQRRAAGQKVWFYQASGPAKLFDPYRYHRLQAWECFRYGAVGMGFWAFGDPAGAKTSWNEYTATGSPYTPVFLGTDDVTDGTHWQAVREGVEDFEYLAMLRDAADRTKDADLRAQAKVLLAEAPGKVVGPYQPDVSWSREEDRTLADTYRLKALGLLEKIQ